MKIYTYNHSGETVPNPFTPELGADFDDNGRPLPPCDFRLWGAGSEEDIFMQAIRAIAACDAPTPDFAAREAHNVLRHIGRHSG